MYLHKPQFRGCIFLSHRLRALCSLGSDEVAETGQGCASRHSKSLQQNTQNTQVKGERISPGSRSQSFPSTHPVRFTLGLWQHHLPWWKFMAEAVYETKCKTEKGFMYQFPFTAFRGLFFQLGPTLKGSRTSQSHRRLTTMPLAHEHLWNT